MYNRSNPNSQAVEYPERQLLGIGQSDKHLIEGVIIEYFK
ncbi:phage virion morphogenesis protein [Citrobacter cronae]|nr:phage virion morphogenesis protein [Citrobacter cronae]